MNKLKHLFATPKKAVLSVCCFVAVLALLAACATLAVGAIAQNTSIGEENARNFAFADAGVDPLSATQVQSEFGFEQGQFVYEIEFVADGAEYDYWIKASDGSVVKKEVEIIGADGTGAKASATITADAAKETALADAGVAAADATFTEEKLTLDDGVSVYEFTFRTADAEYEYEIDANTGTVRTKNREPLTVTPPAATGDQSPQPSGGGQVTPESEIGLEQAKVVALADAGVAAADAAFTKTARDYDDGILVYDIEFYTAAEEYDYEINAADGSIRSKEIEPRKTSGNTGNADSYISVNQAQSIAVGHAGLSRDEVSFSKAKLEHDDGLTVYEIEFSKNGVEYEYTVDAVTGNVLSYDSEQDD